MSARRLLVAATTNDAISTEDIRTVNVPSAVSLWASCVTLTDTVGLFFNKTELVAPSIVNIHAAALSLVNLSDDGVIFDTIVGEGTLRVPVVVTTSAIIHMIVEPVLA